MADRRRLGSRGLAAGATLGLLAAAAGWGITDRLERDNDFCNACHLDEGIPLHREIRRDFDATPAVSLAGAHANAPAGPGGFRCIDCHGGASWAGRARVKALAAADAFWYVVGRFEEPDGMLWPLWDEDCVRCHPGFDTSASPAWEVPRFHELAVHNAALGIDCVECHRAHVAGDGSPYFLSVSWVRTRCARCHTEFEEEDG